MHRRMNEYLDEDEQRGVLALKGDGDLPKQGGIDYRV